MAAIGCGFCLISMPCRRGKALDGDKRQTDLVVIERSLIRLDHVEIAIGGFWRHTCRTGYSLRYPYV